VSNSPLKLRGYFDNSGIVTALDVAHGTKVLDLLEPEIRPLPYLRFREQRVRSTEELGLCQVQDPVADDSERFLPHRKIPGCEGLAELGFDIPCVLMNLSLVKVDMPKLEGGNCAIVCACQKDKSDERAVAALDIARGTHPTQNMQNLLAAHPP
jgi:hypothetical protein